ncbi:NUDIX hydrolase [Pseudonocardia humida]|uniref:NUDIX hydrolase n=1 Tax=Pseudonocardia humida TaxID=2800819 RepID=A0ABT1A8G7_9PSEU|nr:NUDIX domain-containing protein [Pseudonocardia humida]MCO1659261.1 NUDIX hydrolase [Pseudonocardia humida]
MRGNVFAVTVELVVLTVRDGRLQVLLVRREMAPHAGELALPGGFVRPQEDLLETAARELAEGTGLALPGHHLEQLGSYAAPDRDPRGRVLGVGHLALVPAGSLDTTPVGGHWSPVEETGPLAFDHAVILTDGVERARAKLEYTTLAASFCPEPMTVTQLRRVYEAVWGVEIDPRNFNRKVTSTPGFLLPTEERTSSGRGRPAQLFKRGPATVLHPPMLREPPAQ